MGTRLFLSHATVDKALAERLVASLEGGLDPGNSIRVFQSSHEGAIRGGKE